MCDFRVSSVDLTLAKDLGTRLDPLALTSIPEPTNPTQHNVSNSPSYLIRHLHNDIQGEQTLNVNRTLRKVYPLCVSMHHL